MTFPAKVFVSFVAAFALAAVLLFSAAITGERRTFSELESSQVAAAFENVRRELDRGSEDVSRRVSLVAESEATLRMALDLSRPQPFVTSLGPMGLELRHFRTRHDSRNPYAFQGRTESGETFTTLQAVGNRGLRLTWCSNFLQKGFNLFYASAMFCPL